jgi:hypothetical protein
VALCVLYVGAAAIGLRDARHGHGTEVFFRSLRYTEKELIAFSTVVNILRAITFLFYGDASRVALI